MIMLARERVGGGIRGRPDDDGALFAGLAAPTKPCGHLRRWMLMVDREPRGGRIAWHARCGTLEPRGSLSRASLEPRGATAARRRPRGARGAVVAGRGGAWRGGAGARLRVGAPVSTRRLGGALRATCWGGQGVSVNEEP